MGQIFFVSLFFFLSKDNPNTLTAVPVPWLTLGEQIPSHPFFLHHTHVLTQLTLFPSPHFYSALLRSLALSFANLSPLKNLPVFLRSPHPEQPFSWQVGPAHFSHLSFAINLSPLSRPHPLPFSFRSAFCFDLAELSFGLCRDPISFTANVLCHCDIGR